MVHLAFVLDTKSQFFLYANGVLVGVLPATGVMLPMTFIGDPRASFTGLLLGCRLWDVNLHPSDIQLAAKQGPLGSICQSSEDCIYDMELSRGHGSVVRDRTGDRASHIFNGKWETLPSDITPSSYVMPMTIETEAEVEKATVVGVWTRSGSGDADRYGKGEKEVIGWN